MKDMRIIFGIIFIAGLLFTVTPTQAQSPPPPPPAEHGVDGNSNPRGGAPIDGGLGILLALGAAYGGKKLYQAYKEKKESSEEETDEVT